MSDIGKELLEAAEQALAFVRDSDMSKVRVTIPPEIDAKTMREKAGLTQEEFAERFGFDLDLLKDWEIGRRVPDGAARKLLLLLYKQPEVVLDVLSGTH